jgi:hypothetical protein
MAKTYLVFKVLYNHYMYPVYRDIRDRLGAPLWCDNHGVPRYDEFHPKYLGIYDDYAALFLVQCQSCHQTFPCAIGSRRYRINNNQMHVLNDIYDFLEQYVSWGDAPWHDNNVQCAGTTMSSSVVKLLSVWEKVRGDWEQIEITQKMTDLVTEW